MSEAVSLIPVRPSEVAVGKPLPWPVYDWHGKRVLEAGTVIQSQDQLNRLIETGFVPDSSWDTELPRTVDASNMKKVSNPAPAITDAASNKDVMVDMDDMHWYVGETLYLQVLENPAIRYTVHLIGFVKNKTVFVTAPSADGKFEFVRDGQTFVVRAFSGKKAYAFTAAAVKSVHAPHPYLHLSYPKQVRCTIVRQGVRAQVKIIAAVSLGEPERTAAGTLTDLSMGGGSAVTKVPLGKKGEAGRIKFKVSAAGQDEFLNLQVVLRSIAPTDNNDGFKHGFEFVGVPVHDRLILSAFVHQTLVETD